MDLAALTTAVYDKGYGTDVATQVTDAINATYRRLVGFRRWPFLEATSTAIVTVVGTSSYSLSAISDLLHLDAVRSSVGIERFNMGYVSPQEFRDISFVDDRVVGVPRYWTFMNQTLQIYPTPDLVYTLTIDYAKDPPDLAAAGDKPLLPATYHDILVWGAACDLAYRERDYQAYAICEQKYNMGIKEMQGEYGLRQRQTSQSVIHSGIWARYENVG